MSYYQGDFYQGDFYQGDFRSFFGKGLGALGSFIPGVGGIVSRIGSKIASAVGRHPTLSAAGSAAVSGVVGAGAERIMQRPTSMRPGVGLMRTPSAIPGGLAPRGFHMSKPRRGVPSHLVRNRHMRVTNPRALRRAIRRARGFERVARKVMHFVSPRKTKGRAVFKTRRKARG